MTTVTQDNEATPLVGPNLEPWGRHAIADCRGVAFDILNDSHSLVSILRHGIKDAGATLLNINCWRFTPYGVTVCAILAESHVTIHTYPEHGVAMLDAFTCGCIDPRKIIYPAVAALKPSDSRINLIERGYRPASMAAIT
jgi:S-adenosylmethionine decarboxylase proenzyme